MFRRAAINPVVAWDSSTDKESPHFIVILNEGEEL